MALARRNRGRAPWRGLPDGQGAIDPTRPRASSEHAAHAEYRQAQTHLRSHSDRTTAFIPERISASQAKSTGAEEMEAGRPVTGVFIRND
jgi:hypothetical protein